MNNQDIINISTNSSCDNDTIPDEEYINNNLEKNKKTNYYNILESKGPNINLKCFKKKYNSEEEKHYIFEKIKIKKKTELCKNWELYHDCFYKDECSFAHGIEELRNNSCSLSYKTRICKTFSEKSFCNYGIRCNYRHIFKEKRLFTYTSLINNISKDFFIELSKKENYDITMLQLYNQIISRRKVIM
jgi:hypothetical protein